LTPKISNFSALVGNQLFVLDGSFQFDFGVTEGSVLEVLQNVYNTICTPLGSQPLQRAFGTDWSIIDQPGNLGSMQMQQAVLLACAKWEPRANFNTIQFSTTTENALNGEYGLYVELTVDLDATITQQIMGPPAATTTWVVQGDMQGDEPTVQQLPLTL
jgi:phage baseplate assembly protein W